MRQVFWVAKCSFEIVADGGEVYLDGGFGETAPSHFCEVSSLVPSSEYLLDPNSDSTV